jgi:hypothetical protein
MARRNIKKLLEQAKQMPTTELYASEIQALYEGAQEYFGKGAGIWSCLCTGWDAGYAAGYNRALKEVKAAQKKERGL